MDSISSTTRILENPLELLGDFLDKNLENAIDEEGNDINDFKHNSENEHAHKILIIESIAT